MVAAEAIAPPTDPVDERIEVGFLIVGAGPGRSRRGDPARPADGGGSRRRPSGSATCRSRCSRRARRPARTCSPARSSTRAGCSGSSRAASGSTSMPFYGAGARRVGAVPDEAPRAFASRRRRRWSTTATTSRRSRSSGAGSPRRPRRSARRSCRRRRRSSCSSTAAACVGVRTGDRGRGRSGEELGELRAGLGHHRARDDPLRGDAGASDRRGARSLRAARREPAGVGARRQGGLEGREAARRGHAHDGLAAARRRGSSASSAARSSIRWATTWSRSGWSSASTTATRSCRCTTCCRS